MKHESNISGSMIKIFGLILIVVIIILAIYYFAYDRGNKKNSASNYETGKSLMAEKKFKDSVKYFQQAVSSDPGNVEYLKDLAVAQYNSLDYKGAIKTYERVIKIQSNDAFSYNGMGNIYRDLGDELAAEFYRKAIDANPNYIVAYNNLAQLYQQNGKKNEAIAVLEEGVKANPDSEELKNALVQTQK